jgi:dienelactone hydrolase
MTAGAELPGYRRFEFADGPLSHAVYHAGDDAAPPLLLLPELPGIAPGLLAFAERLRAAGYKTYIAQLFGGTGKRTPLRNATRLCISREFAFLRGGVSAPVTLWLRALAGHLSGLHGGAPVGAIGMCVTGGFVIPLVLHPRVTAVVAAQPSIPLSLSYALTGRGRSPKRGALPVAGQDLQAVRLRLESGACAMLAVRCRADRLCPPDKLQRLQQEFPLGLTVREYGGADDRNPAGQRRHATYTKEYRLAPDAQSDHPAQQAWTDLLHFLAAHLPGAQPPT